MVDRVKKQKKLHVVILNTQLSYDANAAAGA